MKCLVLAAGYATRLYPLTKNFPKPLLKVGEKSIIDWLLDDIEACGRINEYIVISNHKFAEVFYKWSKTKSYNITIVDDGTESNESRLGAVKDISLAVDSLEINDDMLVIAGDNVLDFSLCRFMEYAENKKTSCVMRYYEASEEKLRKCGVLSVNEDDLVVEMEEKPAVPMSHWCCPPFYYYVKEDVKLIKRGLESGCGSDAPGSYIAWLCRQRLVHAMKMPGKRYDIGDLKSYERVGIEYKGILK
jgi:glucose-1-phosphate thymidylyltransferase